MECARRSQMKAERSFLAARIGRARYAPNCPLPAPSLQPPCSSLARASQRLSIARAPEVTLSASAMRSPSATSVRSEWKPLTDGGNSLERAGRMCIGDLGDGLERNGVEVVESIRTCRGRLRAAARPSRSPVSSLLSVSMNSFAESQSPQLARGCRNRGKSPWKLLASGGHTQDPQRRC